MVNKVKNRLDHYLGFDSDLIFKQGDPIIFGGAIRDSIADQEIHDVDIISGPETAKRLDSFLQDIGFKLMEKLISKEMSMVYKEVQVISEPWTYVNGYGSVVQVIRPSRSVSHKPNSIGCDGYKDVISRLVNEVDLSCCGVSYDGENIIDGYKNATIHCLHKVFIINSGGYMKTGRIHQRIDKLVNRGWLEISEIEERDVLINDILNDPSLI